MKLPDTISKYKNLLPLTVLLAVCIHTIYVVLVETEIRDGLTYSNYFQTNHILGFIAVGVNVLLYFVKRNAFNVSITVTLILGLMNIVNFTYSERTISFTTWKILEFQPLSFLIGVSYYALNFKKVNGIIISFIPKATDEEIRQQQRELIDKYKSNFTTMTDRNLQDIIEEKKLVDEALVAAQELLEERISIAK